MALSGNYLKVQLATPRAANRIFDVAIGGVTTGGLRESASARGATGGQAAAGAGRRAPRLGYTC